MMFTSLVPTKRKWRSPSPPDMPVQEPKSLETDLEEMTTPELLQQLSPSCLTVLQQLSAADLNQSQDEVMDSFPAAQPDPDSQMSTGGSSSAVPATHGL